MRDREDLPYIVIERESGGFSGFFWGALLGAGAALLLAPRSGAETQREIRERVQRLRDTAESRVGEARDVVERTRDEVTGRIQSVRDAFESKADRAREAVGAGRRAAHDARSELERRVEEAKAASRRNPAPDPGVTPRQPDVEVVVTEVIVEEEDGRGAL